MSTSALKEALKTLAEALPSRLSIRQALAFIYVAEAEHRGQQITMSDLKEYFGDEGKSVANTFEVFYDSKDRDPHCVGWVTQENDPSDRRKKFLRLTAEGHRVARMLNEQMETAA